MMVNSKEVPSRATSQPDPLFRSRKVPGQQSLYPHAHTTDPSGLPHTSSKSTSVPLSCLVQVRPLKCVMEPFVPTRNKFDEFDPHSLVPPPERSATYSV